MESLEFMQTVCRPLILHTIKNLCRETGGVPLAVISILKVLTQTYPQYDFVLAAHPGQSPLISSPNLDFPQNFKWISLANNQGSSFSKYIYQCARDKNLPFLVHDHGIWLPNNHAIASASRHFKIPRIVSVHGMLEPWAWQHKAWKKRIAWHIFQKSDLERAHTLHSTSNLETFHIQQFLPKQTVVTIPLGVDIPTINYNSSTKNKDKHQKTLLFLSRIHPKKGIENLIYAFNKISFKENWQLIIAGTTEDKKYLNYLKSLVLDVNLQKSVEFIGAVQGIEKLKTLESADLFVLPTFSENFGIVVAEALAAGIPVITTKSAPWQDLITHDCGWWIDVGISPLVEALQQAISLSSLERQAMGQRGRQLIEKSYTWQQTAKKLMEVYEAILNDRPIPYSN
jgi:glycosyltransferase involved in cell wall biosynthesis